MVYAAKAGTHATVGVICPSGTPGNGALDAPGLFGFRRLLCLIFGSWQPAPEPSALMRRSTAFWMRSELLLSSHPSIIQAIEATMKIANPETVTRAFQFVATNAAARIVAAVERPS